jgi:hypothetical protein
VAILEERVSFVVVPGQEDLTAIYFKMVGRQVSLRRNKKKEGSQRSAVVLVLVVMMMMM